MSMKRAMYRMKQSHRMRPHPILNQQKNNLTMIMRQSHRMRPHPILNQQKNNLTMMNDLFSFSSGKLSRKSNINKFEKLFAWLLVWLTPIDIFG
uniref:Uncharacterized protein n=1 Tax=Brassica oleracea var. oleracea TaxID=109376 RepID=A0A0D3A569_BRAOL